MNNGIIGALLFLYLIWNYNKKILSVNKSLSYNNPYKMALLVFIIGFIGIFTIHSSSTQIIGYYLGFSYFNKLYFLAIFLLFTDIFIKESIKENQNIKVR